MHYVCTFIVDICTGGVLYGQKYVDTWPSQPCLSLLVSVKENYNGNYKGNYNYNSL